jgi:hypothetical protein
VADFRLPNGTMRTWLALADHFARVFKVAPLLAA